MEYNEYNQENVEKPSDSERPTQDFSGMDQMSTPVCAQQQQQPAPMLAPPAFSPPIPAWQNGPSGIRSCLNRNTYVWLTNGSSFWFFPTIIGRNTMIGFRWRGFGWVYHRIELRRIRSYQCF